MSIHYPGFSWYHLVMLIGAHLSIAGGLEKAVTSAAMYGFETLAMFVRNQRQWRAATLTDEALRRFKLARRTLGVGPIAAHGSYLVNLAGRPEVRRKSLTAMADEMDRCGRMGVEYLVIHPGSNPSEKEGIELISDGLNELMANFRRPKPIILLETTAGAGASIGGEFGQLANILTRLARPKRFGVCLDTCHIFAAGYDIRTPIAYKRTMDEFDRAIDLDKLKVVHINDSVGALGSHHDRHAHIGRGRIGRRGLANFVRDGRFADVPFILETPKGHDQAGRDWDSVNAAALRRLLKKRTSKRLL